MGSGAIGRARGGGVVLGRGRGAWEERGGAPHTTSAMVPRAQSASCYSSQRRMAGCVGAAQARAGKGVPRIERPRMTHIPIRGSPRAPSDNVVWRSRHRLRAFLLHGIVPTLHHPSVPRAPRPSRGSGECAALVAHPASAPPPRRHQPPGSYKHRAYDTFFFSFPFFFQGLF